MPKHNLATSAKIVDMNQPLTDGGTRNGKGINLKNCTQATVIVHTAQNAGAGTPINLLQATDAAGTGLKPLANTVPIWHNPNTAATDTLVRQADAISFTPTASTGNKQTVIHIDPSQLDVNNGFNFLFAQIVASSTSNTTSVVGILDGYRYQGDTIPSAITA